jgi:hypothetical protein
MGSMQNSFVDIERRFREELALLERTQAAELPEEHLNALTPEQRKLLARTAVLDLCRKYRLKVDDLIGFFDEEEALDYLQSLMKP